LHPEKLNVFRDFGRVQIPSGTLLTSRKIAGFFEGHLAVSKVVSKLKLRDLERCLAAVDSSKLDRWHRPVTSAQTASNAFYRTADDLQDLRGCGISGVPLVASNATVYP
jgi:hypothetical protein